MNAQSDTSGQVSKAKRQELLTSLAPLILRWALAVTILSAVADRFGLWGPPGAVNISWGNWSRFVGYTAKVNSFLPAAVAPELAIVSTVAELVLGLALLLGVWPRLVAWATCGLLTLFAVAMTFLFWCEGSAQLVGLRGRRRRAAPRRLGDEAFHSP